jgi:DNA-binding IclR family transcriptional regulator
LHSTGVGKVLLAHAPHDVQATVLADLPRLTAFTVVQPGRLRAQLARVVRDGYATTVEEMSLGACSIAVPVWGPAPDSGDHPDGGELQVVAAIGVVVPTLKRRPSPAPGSAPGRRAGHQSQPSPVTLDSGTTKR